MVHLVIDQEMQTVFFGEACYGVVFVLPDAGREVGGYAGVDCAVAFVCHDVNGGEFLGHFGVGVSDGLMGV